MRMSRTDATDPVWVIKSYAGVVTHDHSRGICRIEGPARPVRIGWKHWAACPRRTQTTVPCPGAGTCSTGFLPLGCPGQHAVTSWDASVPCGVCDSAPVYTCWLDFPADVGPTWSYRDKTPPAWWRRHVTHARNRTDQRARLGAVRKEYNAGVRADCGCLGPCDCDGYDTTHDAWDAPAFTRANANVYWD